ncbi:DUF1294 domain-containing protein [Falsiporphyromonas endometrii]|uniref:DUF1294 domain-containing protein n=1 Tax=Falsiporphyromonas endometrii TaxID=1387297 RepID=A0ABV9K9V6_9PORP
MYNLYHLSVSELILGSYLMVINLLSFWLFFIDKRRAIKRRWRIKESTLLMMAVLGGSIGALTGMYIFRHKTLHKKFRYGIPLIMLLQIAAALYFRVYRVY